MRLLQSCLFIVGVCAAFVFGTSTTQDKIRTIITTDMESDDLASLLRYLLYTPTFDTQGIIYTSARFHWAGDGKGTKFFLPDREYETPQTSWRWTGTRTIQDKVLKAYAEVYPNLKAHNEGFPEPQALLDVVKIGNIIFEGEMEEDTDGSNLIKEAILDETDTRTLYLQAWGGTNTIARALKSLEETRGCSPTWPALKDRITENVVILASGFQDNTYEEYILPHWPTLRVHNLSGGYLTWSFHCDTGGENLFGLPEDQVYWSGNWTKSNIQVGPLGSLYRSWLDGQSMEGDHLDVFGDPEKAKDGWCKPLGQYDFLSEGDNVVFNGLLDTGLRNLNNPGLGSWGGRLEQNETVETRWDIVEGERGPNGTVLETFSTDRWIRPAQNDFAARMQWTFTGEYSEANHPPVVKIVDGEVVQTKAGETVTLSAEVSDPDDDEVNVKWWQYFEEGTYSGLVNIKGAKEKEVKVEVPDDAEKGQTISVILEGTDDGEFPLTRYDRVTIEVV